MRHSWLPLLILLAACPAPAAHPISISQENVFVDRTKVVVDLQIFAEDLYVFQDLRPDDRNFVTHAELKAGAEKHAAFLLQRVRILDVDGKPLKGRTTKVDDSALVEPGFTVPELAYLKIVYSMEFELEQPPEFLTFTQDIVGLDVAFRSEVQLNLKQSGAAAEQPVVLRPGEPRTFRFEWNDEPLSDEATDEQRKAWFEAQREKQLGIVDFESAYSFIYVTDRGLRHEILIPFVTLESFFIVDREKRSFLEVEEQAAARAQIGEFFKGVGEFSKRGEPVTIEIDGIEVAPVVDRIDFFEVDVRDFAARPEASRVSTANSRVGIILSYPAKQPPENVSVTWNRHGFSRMLLEVRSVAIAYEEASLPVFSIVQNLKTFEWTSPGRQERPPVRSITGTQPPAPTLSIPVVSVVCLSCLIVLLPFAFLVAPARGTLFTLVLAFGVMAGISWPYTRFTTVNPLAASPPIPDADSIFETLHANTYRAFDYRDESDVYDALAKSIDGDLLRETYLRIRRGLEMQDQGGAVSLVDEVEVGEGEMTPLPAADRVRNGHGFRYSATWTVKGSVEHWGHVHSRTNRYNGEFVVRLRDDTWKITELDILDEERVGSQTGVRKF